MVELKQSATKYHLIHLRDNGLQILINELVKLPLSDADLLHKSTLECEHCKAVQMTTTLNSDTS